MNTLPFQNKNIKSQQNLLLMVSYLSKKLLIIQEIRNLNVVTNYTRNILFGEM